MALAELAENYGKKLATLEDRIRKKQNVVAAGEDQSRYGYAEALVDVFARGPGAAARRVGKAATKAKSTARDKDDLADVARETRGARRRVADGDRRGRPRERSGERRRSRAIVSKPKKTGITVHLVALAWRST